MIIIEGGIVALLRDGRIINFPDRAEYDEYIKTDESKEFSILLASPEMVLEDIREGKDAIEQRDILFQYVKDNFLFDEIQEWYEGYEDATRVLKELGIIEQSPPRPSQEVL